VLTGAPLAGSAKRFEDSNELADAVANDPNGIGSSAFHMYAARRR
jgi:hypothetical protein